MHQFILKYTVKLKNLPSVESLAISLAKKKSQCRIIGNFIGKKEIPV